MPNEASNWSITSDHPARLRENHIVAGQHTCKDVETWQVRSSPIRSFQVSTTVVHLVSYAWASKVIRLAGHEALSMSISTSSDPRRPTAGRLSQGFSSMMYSKQQCPRPSPRLSRKCRNRQANQYSYVSRSICIKAERPMGVESVSVGNDREMVIRA